MDDGKYTSDYIGQDEIMKEINYPKEIQRSDFVTYACDKQECNKTVERFCSPPSIDGIGYAVTVVVEGGINPCLAILNDIQRKRPVVFVQVFHIFCINTIHSSPLH